jgi:hypothetical protein
MTDVQHKNNLQKGLDEKKEEKNKLWNLISLNCWNFEKLNLKLSNLKFKNNLKI